MALLRRAQKATAAKTLTARQRHVCRAHQASCHTLRAFVPHCPGVLDVAPRPCRGRLCRARSIRAPRGSPRAARARARVLTGIVCALCAGCSRTSSHTCCTRRSRPRCCSAAHSAGSRARPSGQSRRPQAARGTSSSSTACATYLQARLQRRVTWTRCTHGAPRAASSRCHAPSPTSRRRARARWRSAAQSACRTRFGPAHGPRSPPLARGRQACRPLTALATAPTGPGEVGGRRRPALAVLLCRRLRRLMLQA
jgi:hypothetical protein